MEHTLKEAHQTAEEAVAAYEQANHQLRALKQNSRSTAGQHSAAALETRCAEGTAAYRRQPTLRR